MMTRRSSDNHRTITVMRGDIPIAHKRNAKDHIDTSIHDKKRSVEEKTNEFVVEANSREHSDEMRDVISDLRHLIVWESVQVVIEKEKMVVA